MFYILPYGFSRKRETACGLEGTKRHDRGGYREKEAKNMGVRGLSKYYIGSSYVLSILIIIN